MLKTISYSGPQYPSSASYFHKSEPYNQYLWPNKFKRRDCEKQRCLPFCDRDKKGGPESYESQRGKTHTLTRE